MNIDPDPGAKAKIDAMTKEERRIEVSQGKDSIFYGGHKPLESIKYLKLLVQKDRDEEEAERRAEDVGLKQDAIEIAREANAISKSANRRSKVAIWVAVGAFLLSLVKMILDD